MSKEKTRDYHRGGVRMDLIRAAVEALKTQTLESVSMRKLAAAIGVSHNAPYMHFDDKEALWQAISDAGFELLIERIALDIEARTLWMDRLKAGCTAYVKFAEENREYMLVMFRPATPGTVRALSPKGTEALNLLERELAEAVSKGHLTDTDPEKLAVLIWFMLHGLTMAQLQIGGERGPLVKMAGDDRIGWMLDQVLGIQSQDADVSSH